MVVAIIESDSCKAESDSREGESDSCEGESDGLNKTTLFWLRK